MSEPEKIYKTLNGINSLSDFKHLPCAQPYCSGGYEPPRPSEVSDLIRITGWSQREVALITGVAYNDKGSTTVRKWKSPTDKKEARVIPYAAWRQMLEVAGVVRVSEVREALNLK